MTGIRFRGLGYSVARKSRARGCRIPVTAVPVVLRIPGPRDQMKYWGEYEDV